MLQFFSWVYKQNSWLSLAVFQFLYILWVQCNYKITPPLSELKNKLRCKYFMAYYYQSLK